MLKKIFLSCAVFFSALAQGCYSAGGLRHLAYRVSLVEDGKTTVAELQSIMGAPDEVRAAAAGGRVLVFSDLRRSRGRRVPLLGRYIGHEAVDTVTCAVRSGTVLHCDYEENIRE